MDPQNWRPDWIFAITTLLIRFFGIFVVLGILQIGMQISGYIFRRLAERDETQLTSDSPMVDTAESSSQEEESLQPETAAAIGVALSLYQSEVESPIALPTEKSPTSPSEWTIMGRMAQLQSRVFKGRA